MVEHQVPPPASAKGFAQPFQPLKPPKIFTAVTSATQPTSTQKVISAPAGAGGGVQVPSQLLNPKLTV